MSDPLSVAASIVGILAAAGKVIEIIGPYISATKDTPKIAASVHSEVLNSRIVLSALHGLLSNLSAASRNRTLLVPIDNLITVFTNGVLIFSELEALVSPLAENDRVKARMKWARKEGELSALLVRLQAFKSTTLLMLNVLQCDSDRRAAETQNELSGKISIILQNTDIARRLGGLEDTFDALVHIERRKTVTSTAPSAAESDAQSFYSVGTMKPTSQPTSSSILSRDASPSPSYMFEAHLHQSRVYKRAQQGESDYSTRGSVSTSKAWSVFSGVSLSDVSVLSAVAIPVYPADISNAHHYEFMQQTARKAHITGKPSSLTMGRWADTVKRVTRPSSLTMGHWAETVKRVARPSQLSFDTEYEVPHIFLRHPERLEGILIDGSARSILDSRSSLPVRDTGTDTAVARQIFRREQDALRAAIQASKQSSSIPRSRAAEKKPASWVVLLDTIQVMERDSREWQKQQQEGHQARSDQRLKSIRITRTQTVVDDFSLAVAIQPKLRSWGSLPLNFKKPCATITWHQLVELAAMLGICWVDFDYSRHIYRGHGDGYTLSGENVTNIGVVFTFRNTGHGWSAGERVIPAAEIQSLCFGMVPTMYQSRRGGNPLYVSIRTQADLSTLFLSTTADVVRSLEAMGCNAATTQMFAQGKRVTHIFPVVFEVTGMLARCIHIRGSCFRRLPNPTPHRWNSTTFSIELILNAFIKQLDALEKSRNSKSSYVQTRMLQLARDITDLPSQHVPNAYRSGENLSLQRMNQLHQTIEGLENILLTRQSEAQMDIYTTGPSLRSSWLAYPELSQSEPSDAELRDNPRKRLVLYTMRAHVEQVLAGLNQNPGAELDHGSTSSETGGAFDTSDVPVSWTDIVHGPPELEEAKLMEIYFQVVRPKVIEETTVARSWNADDEPDFGDRELWKVEDVTPEDIWCALVFRSICWLMLHDFSSDDVQISKRGVYGNSQLVYIS